MTHIPQTIESIKAEITALQSEKFREQKDGVEWLHIPAYSIDGLTRRNEIHCTCGTHFNCDSSYAPTNQPMPTIWVGLQAFKKHLAERKGTN